jgi:hypothetical protein
MKNTSCTCIPNATNYGYGECRVDIYKPQRQFVLVADSRNYFSILDKYQYPKCCDFSVSISGYATKEIMNSNLETLMFP